MIFSEKVLVWIAAVLPPVSYLVLTLAVLVDLIWFGWAMMIIIACGFFNQIKKRKSSWLYALNVSLAICGPAFGAIIIFIALR